MAGACCCAGASCAAASCAASCAATSACCASAASSAAMMGAISSMNASHMLMYSSLMHSGGSYNDEDDNPDHYGNIKVGLKYVKEQVKEAHGFWRKLFIGNEEWEEESMNHIDYLHRIYKVFESLGYTNLVFLDLNSKTIYKDKNKTPNDFEKAINLAVKEGVKGKYKIAMGIDTLGDGKANVVVTMCSKHDVGVYPLIIETYGDKNQKPLVDSIAKEIDKQFKVTKIKINQDDD